MMIVTRPTRRNSASLPLWPAHPPENASASTPMASRMAPGTAERWTALGRAGRPDRAATTGIRATARAGRLAATMAVPMASTIATPMAHQGRFVALTTCPVLVCRDGTYANHAAKPTMAPSTAPITPMSAPLATMTSRTLRSVAPSAASMPSARSRRWAITVNPATATRPMKTSPSTAITSTIVAGGMPAEVPVG